MKFENKEFIPYKFPYEHNYRNYAQFVISNNVDFSKNDYYGVTTVNGNYCTVGVI